MNPNPEGDSPTSIVDAPDSTVEPDSKRVKTEAAPADPPAAPAADASPESPAAPEAAAAVPPTGVPLSELSLAAGSRIEVMWEVEMSDDTDEKIWWGATLLEAEAEAEVGEASIRYDGRDGFAEETKRIVFASPTRMWDVALSEGLPWRVQGSTWEPKDDPEEAAEEAEAEQEALPVGSAVKARFQGGDTWHAATVAAENDDGTLDVLYEDRTLEQGIPREFVRAVALSSAVAKALVEAEETPHAAESIDAFFETFVTSLTSGAMFQRLPPERQQIASEKVRAMRPFFEAELRELMDERGRGAIVTGEDIKTMIPRVAARQAQAQAEAQAQAQQA